MNKHTVIIVPDLVTEPVRTEEWPEVNYERMSKAIGGGLIDRVALTGTWETGGVDAWVDDEGAYKFEPNIRLSALSRLYGRQSIIWGPGFICAYDSEGESLGLDGTTASGLLWALLEVGGDIQ